MPVSPHNLIGLYIKKITNHKSSFCRMLVDRDFVSTDKIRYGLYMRSKKGCVFLAHY